MPSGGKVGDFFASEIDSKNVEFFAKHMSNAFAYCKTITNQKGKPVDYVYVYVNDAYVKITGRKKAEVLGKRATEVFPDLPSEPVDWIGRYGKVAASGKAERFEAMAQLRDVWYSIFVYSPKKGYFAVLFEDVTERKKAEEEVARVASFPTLNPNPVVEADFKGNISYFNPATKKLFPDLETSGVAHPFLFDWQNVVEDFRGKSTASCSREVKVDDQWYHQQLYLVPDSQRVIIYSINITKRKKAEDEREVMIEFLRIANANTSTRQLVKATVDFIQKESGCEAVGIRLKEEEDYPYWGTIGFLPEHVRLESDLSARDENGVIIRDLKGDPVLECLCGDVIRGRFDTSKEFFTEKGTFWTNDTTKLQASITDMKRQARVRNRCNEEGYESVALIPLCVGKTRIGLLQLNDKRKNMFTLENIQTWERIADQLALALSKSISEEDLEKSEKRWSTTISSIGDAVIVTDIAGKITFMNKVAVSLTGWTLQEAADKSLREVFRVVNAETLQEVEDPVDKVLRNGSVVCLASHSVLISKGGAKVPIDDSGSPIRDQDGKVTGVVLVFHDISERKKGEEALYKLNRHLRAISDSDEALMHANEETKFTKEVCNIIVKDCGYALVWVGFAENDKEKTVRPVAFAGFDEGYVDALRVTWDEKSERGRGPTGTVIRTGKPYVCNMKSDVNFNPWRAQADKRGYTASLVLPLISYDGRTFGALNIYSRELNPFTAEEAQLLTELSNDFAYGIMMLRLRKDREQKEETLRKQASLIDLSPNAIIVRKLDGTISLWSKGAEALYGWTKKEALGQDINKLLSTEFPCPLEEILAKLSLEGKWSGEIVHTSKNYRRIVVQSYWLGTYDSNGKIAEMLESNVDITERLRMQTKLEEYAVQLKEYANQMEDLANQRAEQLKNAERLAAIGATAGMVGHDIRNPLQAITGDLYLAKTELASLSDSNQKKEALESMDEIEKNVDYINKIVQDLQDYARPLNPKTDESDLKLVIEGLIAKNNLPSNVKVNVQVADDVRKICTDAYYITRILYNLITNSVQAMPKGGVLTVQVYKEASDTVVIVKDTGVGIPKSIHDKMFTLMFTTKSKGQGFGLPVVKRMTESLGGTVTFESQEGKGTTFKVSLPAQKAKQ